MIDAMVKSEKIRLNFRFINAYMRKLEPNIQLFLWLGRKTIAEKYK